MTPHRVTELKGWSYIELPGGALDGPWRYRWEAQEQADELNARCGISVETADEGKKDE